MSCFQFPKFSIITVVKNDCNNIAKTLKSVALQDYGYIDYIVIDGNSTDSTNEVILEHSEFISTYISNKDDGIYDAMNIGIKNAKGEYILFLNSGDIFFNTSVLSELSKIIQNDNSIDILFGSWLIDYKTSTKLAHCDLNRLRFNHQSIIYRKSLHANFGMYLNFAKFTTADYLFFSIQILNKNTKIYTTNKIISIIDPYGISSSPHTFAQVLCINYLLGINRSKGRFIFYLIFHPSYHYLKKFYLHLLKLIL